MPPQQIRQFCKLESDAELLLKNAMEEMGLSARAHDKILRISRTIADLEGSAAIAATHLAEALQLRIGESVLEATLVPLPFSF